MRVSAVSVHILDPHNVKRLRWRNVALCVCGLMNKNYVCAHIFFAIRVERLIMSL